MKDNFEKYFGRAVWVGTGNDEDMPVMLHKFEARKGESAKIDILGFGVFVVYVNGVKAHREEYLPLNTDFDQRDYPVGEKTAHRAYPECFDISALIEDGENVVAVLLGNGWYNRPIWEENKGYGRKKLCYRITVGERELYSSPEDTVWSRSHITENHFNKGESQDLRLLDGLLSGKHPTLPTIAEAPLKTVYMETDCPRDVKVEELEVKLVYEREGERIYDFGINTVGYPTVEVGGKEGDFITIDFSEELDGEDISEKQSHSQHFNIISDGKGSTARPMVGWIAARYARVRGDAKITSFSVVRSEVYPDSHFECDDEVLNYLYRIYVHTQLCNMHSGTPSDCPHLERRGYTGDGQLVARASMAVIEAERFYRKWMEDILDCQDRLSGNVQYTAPYTLSGGGPGGWGSAIVTVPYEFFFRYGDKAPLEKAYFGMHEYLRYLDDHSEYGLVTSSQKGIWCLGEWVTPDKVALPASYVNTYFYAKSCEKMIKIARLLGKEEDIPALEKRMNERRRAIQTVFFNTHDGNFIGNRQGANAFALDLGLGDERTKKYFISYYEQMGCFDTGIFGTELVSRLLFEYGRADIAIKLITAREPRGFGRFMELGATTIWEYWGVARSHSHPMFGAVCSHLFEYVLGIWQDETVGGYGKTVIKPVAYDTVKSASGYITVKGERLAVAYERAEGSITVKVNVPATVECTLVLGENSYALTAGENEITANI